MHCVDESLLILGDVHGNYEGLRSALDSRCGQDRHVIILGDLVNRGLATRNCVESICRRRAGGLQTTLLMGNHERALLRFLRGGPLVDFVTSGGLATIVSYAGPTRHDARLALAQALPHEHLDLLESAPLFWEASGILLSHVGPAPEEPWRRDEGVFAVSHPSLFSRDRAPLPFLAVCGHYHHRQTSVGDADVVCLAAPDPSGSAIAGMLYPERTLLTFG